MSNIKKIILGSTTYDIEDTEARTQAAAKVADVKLNGTSIVDSAKEALLEVKDNVTTTSATAALSANMGKYLQDEIDALSVRGKFLSTWSCVTGKPTTDPTTLPYTYKTGDFYIVSAISETTNLIPSGTSYTGAASTTASAETVKVGDQYYFDGTTWTHIPNVIPVSVQDVTIGGTSIVSNNTAVIPDASATTTGALTYTDWVTFNSKQDKIPADIDGHIVTYSGVAGVVHSLSIDSAPTQASSNVVSSAGIYTALELKQDLISTLGENKVVTYGATNGTFKSMDVDTIVTEGSANLITSGAVEEVTSNITPSVTSDGILKFGA